MSLLTLLSWHSWHCFFTFTTFQAVWSMFCWLLSGLCWQCHCFDIAVSAVLSVVFLYCHRWYVRCLFAEILWLPAIALCWARHECYPFFWVWMSLYIQSSLILPCDSITDIIYVAIFTGCVMHVWLLQVFFFLYVSDLFLFCKNAHLSLHISKFDVEISFVQFEQFLWKFSWIFIFSP